MLQSRTLPRPFRRNHFSTLPTALQWRNRIHRSRLVALVAATLLQRKPWASLLLSRKPALLAAFSANPTLLSQILARAASHPLIALDFFRWSESALGLRPDLRTRCRMAQILVDYGHPAPARALLAPALRSLPAPAFLDEAARVCRGEESRLALLGLLLEEYAVSGSILDGLEAFRRIRLSGCPPCSRGCDVFLERLISSGEIRVAWCFFATVVRAGVVADSRTWVLLARLLCKEGKLDRALRLVESGVSYEKICSLVVDCYCRNGNFVAAISLLRSMHENDLRPGFAVYSSILDGACRYMDGGVIGSCLRDMFTRGLMPTVPFLAYDLAIQRLCAVEKTYAAEMFLERAWRANFNLGNGTYACLLRALSKAGRVEEAMRMYRVMLEHGVTVNPRCLDVFLKAVCEGEPSVDASQVLKDVIGKGFVPSSLDISEYIASQCCKGLWGEADNLLNLVLEKGIMPAANCCASLVQHYCACKHVDSAIALLIKLKKLGGGLDVTSYNRLLDALTTEGRLVEAVQVFDYMREHKVSLKKVPL